MNQGKLEEVKQEMVRVNMGILGTRELKWIGMGEFNSDKKAFLSDQCKEIDENNRKEKTRDLFKKIRDTKGTFHANMGTIKDRNGNLTDFKKRWQEYTEELNKKDLHDLPGASTRDPTHDKVVRIRPDKQGKSGLQGF